MTAYLSHTGPSPTPQSVSRRTFGKGLVFLLTGSMLGIVERSQQTVPLVASTPNRALTLAQTSAARSILTRGMFAGIVGATFVLDHALHGQIELQLTRVRDLCSKPQLGSDVSLKGYYDHCFALMFRSSHAHRLEQDVYELVHAQTGQIAVWLVPKMSDPDAHFYESVFNSPPM